MSMADFLARLAIHFLDRFQGYAPPPGPPPMPDPAPGPFVAIGRDPALRNLVWNMVYPNFPGGRTQFEAACNSGWVRLSQQHWGFQVEIGPPPGYVPPPPRSEEAPPRQAPKATPSAIAAAFKALRFRKLDTPAPAEVKERFRDLAKRHHPDLAATPAKREKATARMATINQAYDLLKDSGHAL